MELHLVFYDISNNRERLRFSDGLKVLGLTRIQKSVFLGRALPEALEQLLLRTELEDHDRISMLRLSLNSLLKARILGPSPELDEILDEASWQVI